VALATDDPDEMMDRLRAEGQTLLAGLVAVATRSYRSLDESGYFADNLRLLEPAYLRSTTAEGGPGGSRRSSRQRP
jgi:hypothetical protein